MNTSRPRYDEACFAAQALNVIGDRWALLVTRELMLGPKRFQLLRRGLPGISAAVLTTRLTELAEAGVLVRHPGLGYYELTDRGRALWPVLRELARWGAGDSGHDPDRSVSPTALMLSMPLFVRSGAAAGRRDVVGFDMGEEQFTMRLDGRGTATVTVGLDPAGCDVVLAGTAHALAMAAYGSAKLREHIAAGQVAVRGKRTVAQSFLDLFDPWRPRATVPGCAHD